jgi:hypothetical protein
MSIECLGRAKGYVRTAPPSSRPESHSDDEATRPRPEERVDIAPDHAPGRRARRSEQEIQVGPLTLEQGETCRRTPFSATRIMSPLL